MLTYSPAAQTAAGRETEDLTGSWTAERKRWVERGEVKEGWWVWWTRVEDREEGGNAAGKLLGNTAASDFRENSGVIYRWPVREFMQMRQEEIRPIREKTFPSVFLRVEHSVG